MLHDHKMIGDQVLGTLRAHPDRVAFAWDGGSLTYGGARQMIGAFQRVLMGLELEPGSRVAILSANRADAWCTGVAVLLSRLATVWLHPSGSVDDHVYQLADSNARALIVDPDKFAGHGAALAEQAHDIQVFTLGQSEFGVDLLAARDMAGASTARNYSLIDDLSMFNYTGGTTGLPKACVRTQRQSAAMPSAALINLEIPPSPHFLAIGPISHATGHCIIPTLLRGGTVRFVPRFDPAEVVATIERERINSLLAVPTMIYALLDEPTTRTADLASLEWLLYAAAPISPSRLEDALGVFGPIFNQLYGLTECAPLAVLHRADHSMDRLDRLLACGKPAADTTVVLLDDEGREVPEGEIGEICGRAPSAFLEYWNQPDQTEEAFRGGYFHTGDLARADDEGFLYILDRKKDMIVTGGFNVYPREIEDVLTRHPDVAHAAVIGTPHERWGEAVSAVIVRRPGALLTEQDVIDLVKTSKGSVYAPKIVQFVEELPQTGVGKIDKRALRADYWANEGRSIG